MGIGILVVWLSLIVYTAIVLKAGILEKREHKLVYILVTVTVVCSFLVLYNIPLNGILSFLDDTFGSISRMVVKT